MPELQEAEERNPNTLRRILLFSIFLLIIIGIGWSLSLQLVVWGGS